MRHRLNSHTNWYNQPQLDGSTLPTPRNAPLRRKQDFVPGHLSAAIEFWEHEILVDNAEEQTQTMLGWLRGVRVQEFIDPNAQGEFLGRPYSGKEITPAKFQNHVPTEFETWVDIELENLASKGCLAKWTDIADVSKQPEPRLVLALGVEPSKPRLFWDGRWLNKMCKNMPFKMDGVGKVAQVA